MLDTDTKRRIDTARDILVGKVPDPKSQVEQITIALIYKFMDDMDAESEELGGSRKFFAGGYARYGWAKLMHSGLGGHEILNIYAEAITKMPENPGIPPLFRDIFKNAYLPYRDPETLRAFLKIIDEFEYDHSERLGDAFEYLLSVLGSQGDAGQFRTPRHIIDFIVAVVDPQKTETVLDPACGTAGFLISSWKHILEVNTDSEGNCTLTPDDRGRLAQNFMGYDISPDMVRLSLVNLYLHGFTDPHIFEYDTLTSQERWNEFADVILANPPFMSPKGGIKPHNRFSVQSKRAEVLFVDYMVEHLTPGGRAGIIVPEGIIFQNQTAHTQLRRLLVEEALVAVVSLPAGVFNPYSGVKTSILILDKSRAKQSDTIGFFKIENDGFGLGAQRRKTEKNDLPQARAEIADYLSRLNAQEPIEGFLPALGLVVPKEKIVASGDYNLSGSTYREVTQRVTVFPRVTLGELLELEFGTRITKRDDEGSLFPVYGGGGESFRTDTFNREDDVVISRFAMSSECVRVVAGKFYLLDSGFSFSIAKHFSERASKRFITRLLQSNQAQIYECGRGHAQKNIDISAFKSIEVPLPPLELQKEIVAEIEGYQKVINGAHTILDNYRPHIPIHFEWPMVALGEICSFKNGLNFKKGLTGHTLKIIGVSDFQSNLYVPVDDLKYVNLDAPLGSDYLVENGDILFVRSNGNPDLVGRSVLLSDTVEPITFSGFTIRCRFVDDRARPAFFAHLFKSRDFAEMIKTVGRGANIRNLSQRILSEIMVPLPPPDLQKAIVAEIETELALVDTNRELVIRFEKKIQATLARVWDEEAPSPAEA